jgi:hypothetical protein
MKNSSVFMLQVDWKNGEGQSHLDVQREGQKHLTEM